MDRLEIDHLTKRFGDVVALDDMAFEAYAGEIFGFVGANGAGKTTTMRIALGVLAADRGEVRWAGKPLDETVRRLIGYMPEERGLYPRMKVGEQLIYLARLHGLSAAAAAAAVDEWTERLGVAGRRNDEVQKLSLGNQQRVQLAAALIHDPQILVLDEPFSGLDPVAVDVMSGVLRDKADAGVPVVFSSHQLDLVERLCDRVGIVRSGRMAACGTIDAALRQHRHARRRRRARARRLVALGARRLAPAHRGGPRAAVAPRRRRRPDRAPSRARGRPGPRIQPAPPAAY